MKNVIILIGLCRIFDSLFSTAQAAEVIEFVGVGYPIPLVSTENTSIDQNASGSLSYRFGLGFVWDLRAPFSIEVGTLFTQRNFSTNVQLGNTVKYELKLFQIPILLRYQIDSNFSLGGGAYYSTKLGTLTMTENTHTEKAGYDQARLETRDHGLVASLRYRKHLHEIIYFVADGRTYYSLRNLSTNAGSNIQIPLLEILIGISFGI